MKTRNEELEKLQSMLVTQLEEFNNIAAPYNQLKINIARLNLLLSKSDSVDEQKILHDKICELNLSLATYELPRVIARRQELSKSINELRKQIHVLIPSAGKNSPSILPKPKLPSFEKG